MNKRLTFVFVFLFVVGLLIGSMPVKAQEPATVTWVAPALYKVGNPTNMRASALSSSAQLAVAPADGYVEVNARKQVGGDSWVLARLFDKDGHYVRAAWMSEKVANLAAVEEALKPVLKYPVCDIKGTGKRITAPVANTLRFDTKLYLVDSVANGCNLLIEGRQDLKESKHHIWVLRANGLANKSVLSATNGFFDYAEGSIWAYDPGWNMDQDPNSLNKPSIALEFVMAKRQNMLKADKPYNWPIVLHKSDGTTVEFGTGESDVKSPDPKSASCAMIDNPTLVSVNGILDEDAKSFTASVGQTGCNTLVLIRASGTRNWTAEMFDKTHESVDLQDQVLAVEFPQFWDMSKMTGWITNDNLKVIGLQVGDVVTPTGIDGLAPITIS